MPFERARDLPSQFDRYSPAAKRAAVAAFNATLSKTGDEGRAFGAAHNTAKRVVRGRRRKRGRHG